MKNLLILIAAVSFVLILVVTSFAFKSGQQNEEMIILNNGDYEKEWKEIDALEKKGLPKSALKEVVKLYARAKKDNNPSQLIKTLIYKTKYESELEEDGLVNGIYKLEEEMNQSNPLVKSILQSMLAEMYTRYRQQNYWKYNNRTEVVDFDQKDIRTWDLKKLIDASTKLYAASLTFEASKNIEIKEFKAITTKAVNTDELRPSLYDFLTHRALEYFINEQNYLTEPAFKFFINQEEAFADYQSFADFKFESKDTSSSKYNTLLLFQKLIKFHTSDKVPTALIDIDLKRLEFVYNNAVIGHKDQLYLDALKRLKEKYKASASAAEVIYREAQYHLIKGRAYQPNPDNIGKWEKKTAYDLASDAVKKYPKTYGAKLCKNIINEIESKSINLKTEKIVPAQEAFKALVNYQNLSKIHLKVVKVDPATDLSRMNEEEIVKHFNRLDPIKTWAVDLPNDGDFHTHALEIKIDALPFGEYAIISSNNQGFSIDKNAISYMMVKISNLSFMERTESGKTVFVLMDRVSGIPLEGVEASFYKRDFNRKKDKYELTALGTGLTDQNGFVKADLPNRARFVVKFTKGEDVLFLDDNYRNYMRNRNPRRKTQTHFFLDRGIYRPGQTIYFKGIVIEYDENRMPQILSNKKLSVTFYDVNGQEINSMDLVSNAYGTVNGNFVAPKSGLLGQMSIRSSEGRSRKYLRVEEYKRPKFELGFDPVKGTYKLAELVKVSGFAKAYAGSNIDGAKVKYRVVRTVRYPYLPWYYRDRYMPWGGGQNAMEITNGETITDEAGKFEIEFKALADLSIPKSRKPEFSFQVYVDVIDITGETQSSQTSVQVGYLALNAGVKFKNGKEFEVKDFKEIEIFTQNLNGVFEAAKGQVKIELLESPTRVLRPRYWKKPDVFVMTKSEHDKVFPNDVYDDELDFRNWSIAKVALIKDFDSAKEKLIQLGNKDWQLGHYKLTLTTKDKYGTPIEYVDFVTLFDLESNKVPGNQINFSHVPKSTVEPGEELMIYQGSAAGSVKVLFEIARNNKKIRQEWLNIDGMKTIREKIKETYRGGLSYTMYFVKFNRFFSVRDRVNVPWTNKELQIEYASFRDKLSPGQKEEWQLKISGNKKDQVAAEMLATMYDASLDVFANNDWSLAPFPSSYGIDNFSSRNFGQVRSRRIANRWVNNQPLNINRMYRRLNWFNLNFYGASRQVEFLSAAPAGVRTQEESYESGFVADEDAAIANKKKKASARKSRDRAEAVAAPPPPPPPTPEEPTPEETTAPEPVKVRTNLNETVFFFPELMTDKDGSIIVKFTMNEALTRWKFLALAHTKDLKIGISQNEVVTQKELMVMPNPPRFFRENDEIEFTAKVSNLTAKTLNGSAVLELYDAVTMKPIDDLLSNDQKTIQFTAKAGQSDKLAWKLKIPLANKLQAVTHRVIAKAGNYADGEESTLPVLTNRMMVTETLPLPVREKSTQSFSFKSLKEAGGSTTLQHHKMSLEFTSNPAWYAVQALPYLMEYPYQCTEQIFSRFYANSLATEVANAHPKVKDIFESWKNTAALESNLSKNQELKTALLEETPWVLDAQSEAEQKKRIGLLFDLNRMSEEQAQALSIMIDRQQNNGGFSWFPGGKESWHITQYIVEGLGHLDQLGVKDIKGDDKTYAMVNKAIRFIDYEISKQYKDLLKWVKKTNGKMEDDHLNNLAIHYLYARSFFLENTVDGDVKTAFDYYLGQAEKYWLRKGYYQEGLIALALQRSNRKAVAADIVKSLKERSLNNEEMGMYWKYDQGYYWYQMPIETHALMIEVFDEVANDERAVNDLKVWLLKNKQTTNWKTTKATASAVYGLLRRGKNWLLEDKPIEITIAGKVLDQSGIKKEAGTGYFKTTWDAADINADMAEVKVTNPNSSVAWGAMYWQYFENLDKIKTFEETPLQIKKQLFKEIASDTGPKITPITEATNLIPGDKLKVRIEIRVDRDMEYVHLKDMRASGFEPINTISRYKWQGGIGYYESTRDVSTNFFIDYLRKGTYVFEYPLRVVHKGDFSNGITTMQCMYAPEFTSHSEGIRVKVE